MRQTHQATAVDLAGRAILIEGPPGSGKSSLALALIDRGAVLIGDDGIELEARQDRLFAWPHPHTRGLLEVRNLGLIEMPVHEDVGVALVIHLDGNAPRFIEAADKIERMDILLPLVRLWPDSPVLAIRAELALERYGLS